jgi:hypothetical protein
MCIPGGRCTTPVDQHCVVGSGGADSFGQPGVEAVGLEVGIGSEFSEIVIAHAAGGNQHTLAAQRLDLAAQRLERASHRQMHGRIETGFQR